MARTKKHRGPECRWTEDDETVWATACGQMWQFNEGGPVENKCQFCPYCGRRLKAVKQIDKF